MHTSLAEWLTFNTVQSVSGNTLGSGTRITYWLALVTNMQYFSTVGMTLSVPVVARSESAAAGLLRLWVRIPPVAWMSVCVSVVFCQVKFSVSGWSPVQSSPTDFGASLCVIKKPREWGGPGPRGVAAPKEKNVWQCVIWYVVADVSDEPASPSVCLNSSS
jgi:hypothetical protein